MIIWPAKDPDEVADYTWTPALDAGDTIVSHTVVRDSGDVTIDSDSHTDTAVTVWLSGGTVGTSTFTLRITTTGGRTFEESAQIAVEDSSSELLTSFRIRYPEFASVSDETVLYWLNDAYDTTGEWTCDDAEKAQMALAAHNLSLAGAATSGGAVSGLAGMGVTSFKSASMSVNFADSVISSRAAGGYSSTRYGRDFITYLRRCRGGPRLVGCV